MEREETQTVARTDLSAKRDVCYSVIDKAGSASGLLRETLR